MYGRVYRINRTIKGRTLPIYTEYKQKGVTTVIRRIEGNLEALTEDLNLFCGSDVAHLDTMKGHVILEGNFVRECREYFTKSGF